MIKLITIPLYFALIAVVSTATAAEEDVDPNLLLSDGSVTTQDGSPDEFLKFLERIARYCNNHPSSCNWQVRDRVSKFLGASNVTAICENIEPMVKRSKLIMEYRAYTRNVYPYLKSYYVKHWATCKSTIDQKFKNIIESLGDSKLADIETLAQFVVEAKGPTDGDPLGFTRSSQAKGAMEFLKYKNKNIMARSLFRQHTDKSLTKLYYKYVIKLCETLYSFGLSGWVHLYEPMIIDESLAGKADPTVSEWIRNMAICSAMMTDREYKIDWILEEINSPK